MWVYRDEEVEPRLALSRGMAFWFDYWMMLHADESHAIWNARPIGLVALNDLTRNLDPMVDRSLTRAISRELESYKSLASQLPIAPPSTPALVTSGRSTWLAPEWQEWIDKSVQPHALSEFWTKLWMDLNDAISDCKLPTIAFLSRRAASELSDLIQSRRVLLQRTRYCLLRDFRNSFLEIIQHILRKPDGKSFRARFAVGEVSISAAVANIAVGPPNVKLIFTDDAGQPDQVASHRARRKLVGIEVVIDADEVEHAALEALKLCREALHQLRVRHYVRTHLIGAVKLFVDERDDPLWLSLEQPFWSRQPGGREVPRLPPNFHSLLLNVPAGEKNQWNAMRWHVSQAIGYWPEDIHSAASEVWQAIEGFSGGVRNVPPETIDKFLGGIHIDLQDYLATRASFQAWAYSKALPKCDWYYRNSKKTTTAQWVSRVMSKSSYNCHALWCSPAPPDLLFSDKVGLLPMVMERNNGSRSAPWMKERLNLELDHLYGIRNAVVHKGVRVGTERWVAHLSRVGLEVILGSAKERSKHHWSQDEFSAVVADEKPESKQ